MIITEGGKAQAKAALHEAGKIARRLNADMKRYQAALDKGGSVDLLFDAKDDILETVDRLKDVRQKLTRGVFWGLDHNPKTVEKKRGGENE